MAACLSLNCASPYKKPYEEIYGKRVFSLVDIQHGENQLYSWNDEKPRYFLEIIDQTTFTCKSVKFDQNFEHMQERNIVAKYQVSGETLIFPTGKCPLPISIASLNCSYTKADSWILDTRHLYCSDPKGRQYSLYSGDK